MKETYYFSHDYNARNDPKLQKVLMKLGQSGKGVYWDLVEIMYEQGGYLMLSECDAYAFALRSDSDSIYSLIKDFELFESDGEKFWSKTILKRLGKRKEKSEKALLSAKKRWSNANASPNECERNANASKIHANAMRPECEGNAIKESKVKDIKGKQSKEKENKETLSDASASGDFKEGSELNQKKDSTPGPRKTKAEPATLHHLAVKMFCEFYEDKFLTSYEFSGAKDGAAFKQLLPKIKNKIAEAGKEQTDENILKGLVFFLRSIQDDWVIKNFTPAIINLKFNELFTNAKNGTVTSNAKQPNNPERAAALAREFRRG